MPGCRRRQADPDQVKLGRPADHPEAAVHAVSVSLGAPSR